VGSEKCGFGGYGDYVRVFLCDDVAEFRALMRHILEEDGETQIVGEAADGLGVVAAVAAAKPDVILLDLGMPHCDGLQAIPLLRAASPQTRIVVLSGFAAERMAGPALAAGADEYIEKGQPICDIRAALLPLAA